MKELSRRAFLGGAALGTAGLAAGLIACAPTTKADDAPNATPAAGTPITWDKEVEILIIGGGGTGLAAAVEATEKGNTSVLVVEKTGNTGGCTAISGGVVQAAGTKYQKELTEFQDDTPEKHFEYWRLAGEGTIDEDLVKDIANNAPEHVEWLVSQGIVYNEVYGANQIPYVPNEYMAWRIHNPAPEGGGGGGAIHAQALRDSADKNGVEFLFDTEATKLITDPELGVIGVTAKGPEGVINIKALRGVLLATSSIDHNEVMAKGLSHQHWHELQLGVCYTPAQNTGDGIRMALELGAGLTGFGGTISLVANGVGVGSPYPKGPQLLINGAGHRFVCESATYAYGARAVFQQTKTLGKECHLVFGKSATEPDSDSAFADPEALAAALESGGFKTTDSIETLAQDMSVDANNLKATFDQWNNDITQYGEDRQFQRDSGLKVIEPPYYYQPCGFTNLGPIGGVTINLDAQVLDYAGTPIKRLFAGGLCSGGWIGDYYPGSGTAIMGTVHWGRKAANSILALDPWE